jgi:hypothetical protein
MLIATPEIGITLAFKSKPLLKSEVPRWNRGFPKAFSLILGSSGPGDEERRPVDDSIRD